MGGMDFVASIMQDLNRNLAAEKRSLEDMVGGERTYRMRDGSVIEVPEEQVMRLWEVCDDSERIRLRLPIYVGTDTSGEMSSWKVEGTVEASVIAKILGKKVHREGYLRLYNPDLRVLKDQIPDCYLMVFTM